MDPLTAPAHTPLPPIRQELERRGFAVVSTGGQLPNTVFVDDAWDAVHELAAAGYQVRGVDRLNGSITDGKNTIWVRLMKQSAMVISCTARVLLDYDRADTDPGDSLLAAITEAKGLDPDGGRASRLLTAWAVEDAWAGTWKIRERLENAAEELHIGGEFASPLPPADPVAEILTTLIGDLHQYDYGDAGAVMADLIEHPDIVTTARLLELDGPARRLHTTARTAAAGIGRSAR